MANRYLLLFLCLLGVGGTAHAQVQQESLESATHKQRLRSQYLHNDTAQAIINLYGKRQAGGASWIAGAVLAAVRVAVGSTTPQPSSAYVTPDNSASPAAAFLVASPIMAYGVGKLVHYSNGHLEQVLGRYAAGQPLPRALRRKLKPRFFAQPIIEYKAVPVQAAK